MPQPSAGPDAVAAKPVDESLTTDVGDAGAVGDMNGNGDEEMSSSPT